MLVVDSLVAIGMATLSLGTIHEADGVQERTFWLRNAGRQAVAITQGYTSCGCTTIHYAKGQDVAPADSTAVTLRFNPQGKGGEFLETGTIVYGPRGKRITLALTGTCITSEETLLRQFPIRISDGLRLSANRFDLGIMHVGERKERTVVLLHRRQGNRQERITVAFAPDAKTPKGLQHISRKVTTKEDGKDKEITITLDVIVK
ncbi:MAG: DUF1573 domain-containing protein [Prevotella sp.]|nr:DUF1573 domain-containing protein [Prevotella sp.]MBR6998648.1 DUF1573 domain-containing protein [Prevotella sp.]